MCNCFGSNENDRKLLFTICAVLIKNEEDYKLFLIISAKLKIKGGNNSLIAFVTQFFKQCKGVISKVSRGKGSYSLLNAFFVFF